MSLDDQIDTPPATNGNGTSGADEPGAMDEQYAAFQASTAADDTAPPESKPVLVLSSTPTPSPSPRRSRPRSWVRIRSSRRFSSS